MVGLSVAPETLINARGEGFRAAEYKTLDFGIKICYNDAMLKQLGDIKFEELDGPSAIPRRWLVSACRCKGKMVGWIIKELHVDGKYEVRMAGALEPYGGKHKTLEDAQYRIYELYHAYTYDQHLYDQLTEIDF